MEKRIRRKIKIEQVYCIPSVSLYPLIYFPSSSMNTSGQRL